MQAGEAPRSRRSSRAGRRYSSARELVLRTVEAQHAPVSIAALTRSTGLHENTVRGHLTELLADGHITRSRAPADGRGRPAWLWRPVQHGPASPYAALAGVLAETIARTSADPAAAAREAGRTWGRELAQDLPAQSGRADPRATVVRVMADQGFAPEDTGGHITLHRCPLLEAASRQTEVVCSVHRGMIDGLLEQERSAATEVELVPFAAPGQCLLHLRATS